MNSFLQQSIPVADWVEQFTDWLTATFAGVFSVIQTVGQAVMDTVTNTLLVIPPILFILLLGCYSSIIKDYGTI